MCQKKVSGQFSTSTQIEPLIKTDNFSNTLLDAYERDDIFSSKNKSIDLDFWSRTEFTMIGAVVTFIEFALLFFATTRALFSIVKPQVQSGMYSLFVLLPLSILLPVFFSKVDAKEVDLDD